ncbi:MAG: hypothetical protein WA952_20675 [Lewinella sp.]
MGYRITYSRLFSCLIRHDYFLNLGDGVHFNDLDPVADDNDIRLILATYDIKDLLSVIPIGGTKDRLAGHRMKMVVDRMGFYVGMATNPAPSGGRLPATRPSPDTAWHFGLRPRDAAEWSNITNQRMRPNLPALYYFSNRRPGWSPAIAAAPLSLSVPAAARQRRNYAAGERVQDGTDRYRALRDVGDNSVGLTDPAFWTLENPVRGEATDADRVLLPTAFRYTITPETDVVPTTLTATLSDTGGAPALPPANLALSSGRETVRLDFSDAAPGWYDLEITTDTDYATTHRIHLNDDLYDPTLWGVVSIGTPATDPGLRLFEADGRLRLDGGGQSQAPEFQVRIPNRQTYWRYVAHPAQAQALPVDAAFTLDGHDRLVATAVRPLTRFGTPVQIAGGNGPVTLPSPRHQTVLPEADGRVYSELRLGILDL